jgi:hypothetical protein
MLQGERQNDSERGYSKEFSRVRWHHRLNASIGGKMLGILELRPILMLQGERQNNSERVNSKEFSRWRWHHKSLNPTLMREMKDVTAQQAGQTSENSSKTKGRGL